MRKVELITKKEERKNQDREFYQLQWEVYAHIKYRRGIYDEDIYKVAKFKREDKEKIKQVISELEKRGDIFSAGEHKYWRAI